MMKTIKFLNRNTSSIKTGWGILIIILSAFVFSYFDIDLKISHSAIYFALTLSYFLSTFVFSKKITKGVKEFDYDGATVKIVFFNSFKDSLKLDSTEIDSVFAKDVIKIYRKADQKLIGIIYKECIVDIADWDELISYFSSNNDSHQISS